jgi:hypothetical protein
MDTCLAAMSAIVIAAALTAAPWISFANDCLCRSRPFFSVKTRVGLRTGQLSTTFRAIDCLDIRGNGPTMNCLPFGSGLRATLSMAGLQASAMAALLGCISLPAVAQDADLVVVNAKVAAADGPARTGYGIAVRAGRIAAVGPTAEVRRLAGPRTRIVDADGRTVIPGLIDSHMHAVRAALSYSVEVNWIDARTDSRSDVAAAHGGACPPRRMAGGRGRLDRAAVRRAASAHPRGSARGRTRQPGVDTALLFGSAVDAEGP